LLMPFWKRWHLQLLQRRIAIWDGRISDTALDYSLRVYEFFMLVYLSGFVFMCLFLVSLLMGAGAYSYLFIVAGFAALIIFSRAGWHSAKIAGLDVVRSLGLPDSMWRHVKAKTPEQFDRWKATVKPD
jgi:hypothetical protein